MPTSSSPALFSAHCVRLVPPPSLSIAADSPHPRVPSRVAATGGGFGTPAPAAGGFGTPAPAGGGLFGASTPAPAAGGFGAPASTPAAGGGLFGGSAPASTPAFGAPAAAPATSGGLSAPPPRRPRQRRAAVCSAPPPPRPRQPSAVDYSARQRPRRAACSARPRPRPPRRRAAVCSARRPPRRRAVCSARRRPRRAAVCWRVHPGGGGRRFIRRRPRPRRRAACSARRPPRRAAEDYSASAPATGGLFGASAPATGGGGLFGASTPAAGGGLFGASTPATGGGLFGRAGPGGGRARPRRRLAGAQPAGSVLSTTDGQPVKHFTQWGELAPASQENLRALETRIVETREDSKLLDGVARLREGPNGAGAKRRAELERSVSRASDTLKLLETQLWSDNDRLQGLRDAVVSTLRDAEHAQARLQRLKDASAADEAAATHARLHPGQPPPAAAPVYLPAPTRPSPYLAAAVDRLYATAEGFERGTLEMEHNLRTTGRVRGHGGGGPGVEALAAALDGAAVPGGGSVADVPGMSVEGPPRALGPDAGPGRPAPRWRAREDISTRLARISRGCTSGRDARRRRTSPRCESEATTGIRSRRRRRRRRRRRDWRRWRNDPRTPRASGGDARKRRGEAPWAPRPGEGGSRSPRPPRVGSSPPRDPSRQPLEADSSAGRPHPPAVVFSAPAPAPPAAGGLSGARPPPAGGGRLVRCSRRRCVHASGGRRLVRCSRRRCVHASGGRLFGAPAAAASTPAAGGGLFGAPPPLRPRQRRAAACSVLPPPLRPRQRRAADSSAPRRRRRRRAADSSVRRRRVGSGRPRPPSVRPPRSRGAGRGGDDDETRRIRRGGQGRVRTNASVSYHQKSRGRARARRRISHRDIISPLVGTACTFHFGCVGWARAALGRENTRTRHFFHRSVSGCAPRGGAGDAYHGMP